MNELLPWAAGLYEGEGSITARVQPGGRRYSQMALTMCDEEPVRRFANVVQVGNVTGPHAPSNPEWSPRWTWSVNRLIDLYTVVIHLWPWLSARRRDQAVAALAADTRPAVGRASVSEAARANLSAAKTGRVLSDEHREAIAEGLRGNTNGRGLRGRTKTAQHRERIAASVRAARRDSLKPIDS